MQYRTLVTPDSLETDMKGLENWAKQTEKAEDREEADRLKNYGWRNVSGPQRDEIMAYAEEYMSFSERGEDRTGGGESDPPDGGGTRF